MKTRKKSNGMRVSRPRLPERMKTGRGCSQVESYNKMRKDSEVRRHDRTQNKQARSEGRTRQQTGTGMRLEPELTVT